MPKSKKNGGEKQQSQEELPNQPTNPQMRVRPEIENHQKSIETH